MSFTRAQRTQTKLRMAIDGPSGAGKTYSGLRFAFALGARVAVICSENGSAQKYQGENPDGAPFEFDILVLRNYAPTAYTDSIKEAGRLGYDVLLIDSLSHAWTGDGGALDIKDKQGGNSFTAWKNVTPMHNRMIEAILTAPLHVIATMRSKTAFVLETDERGKQVPRKVGMEPVQRAGMEYEFDIYASLDLSHVLKVTKSRCRSVDGLVVASPGPDFMRPVAEWLNSGTPTPKAAPLVDQLAERLASARSIEQLDAAARECKALRNNLTASEWAHLNTVHDAQRAKFQAPQQPPETNHVPQNPAPPPPVEHGPAPAGSTAPSTNGTPAAAAQGPNEPLISQDTLHKIAELREPFLLRHAKVQPSETQRYGEEWRKVLKLYGVESAKQLTEAQGKELLGVMAGRDKLSHELRAYL